MANKISKERINTFMEGRDPMQRIVNILYNYQDDFVTVIYRDSHDEKCYLKQPFYPFLWATLDACKKLCGGDRNELKSLMMRYGIKVTKLSNLNYEGKEIESFKNGYMFLFQATKPMSQTRFRAFFKDARNPIGGKKDKNGKQTLQTASESRQYLTVSPQEQFMIATGKRFFKGYDDYNQLLKMTFDLETTGLDKKTDRIIQVGIKINRPFKGYPNGYERIITVTGETEEDRNASELMAIDTMLKCIATFKPDIITAHNGENFDWEFIISACERIGVPIDKLSARWFNGEIIKKEEFESSLKLGGEVEKFHRTIVPQTIITDSLHAVRRAQATDSNFLRADLKYATDYLSLRKKNRVYTPGKDISNIWADNEEHYAFNDNDGDWYLYNPNAEDVVINDIEPNPDFTVEYFQTILDEDRKTTPSQKEVEDMFAKDNALCEEWSGNTMSFISNWEDEHHHYSENDTAENLYKEYLEDIQKQNDELHRFKKGKEGDKPFIMYTRNYIADGYTLKSGRYIIERYLYDDLDECEKVEYKLNTTNFLICKLLPVTYTKATTMGTAGQWKMLMLAWSYENGLAVPKSENTGSFTGGLSRLLKVGYVSDVVKLDYNSLYPSIILTWGIHDENDLSNAMLSFLEYVLTEREKYKGLKKKAGKIVDAFEERINSGEKLNETELAEYHQAQADYAFNDKKQNQMKVFGNSFFGSYGSNNGSVFPWKSPKCAEQTTCTGRQSLRLMISHFHNLGYTPIVGDTDGFNFKLPDDTQYRYTKEHPYISTGKSRETKEGVAYTGFKADVAEFNDMYMCDMHYSENAVNKMGLGIDEVVDATINFARKNYADYFPEKPFPQDIKMVGNTIKSKKMAEYISKFLSKAIRLLIKGEGDKFLNEYYSTVDKIYNLRIPLKDIASKGKIKKSLKEYEADVKAITKAGRPKSRQAWYELAIANNLDVSNGDTIYYINTGKSKSHSDVKKITHYYALDMFGERYEFTKDIDKGYKAYKAQCGSTKCLSKQEWIGEAYPNYTKEDEITMNCMLVPQDIIEKEGDVYCSDISDDMEYNVAKYVEQFNKRIKPLLVCFSKEIRDKILISNPSERPFFTQEECVLSSGEPNKASDQDTYEQLMTMEDKEYKFWINNNLIPPFFEECKMGVWEDKKQEFIDRMERERQLGIDKERECYLSILNDLEDDEIDDIFSDGEIPESLLKIIEINPVNGWFMSKNYPDIKIGSIDDILDIYESRKNKITDDDE